MTDKEAFDAWADMRGLYFSDRSIYWEGWKEGVKREREACAAAVESVRPTVIGGDPVQYLAIMGFAEKALAAVRTRG
jgi:hypothetical protein